MSRDPRVLTGVAFVGLLVAGSGCQSVAYVAVSDAKSSISVLGKEQEVQWTDTEPTPGDIGVLEVPAFITNSLVDEGEFTRRKDNGGFNWSMSHGDPVTTERVAFSAAGWKESTTRLISREVRNVFGSTVFHWGCNVDVFYSKDEGSYLLELYGYGGGPQGYTVLLGWTYDHEKRVIDLDVVEELPGHSARRARLIFRVNDALDLVPIKEDMSGNLAFHFKDDDSRVEGHHGLALAGAGG